MTAVEGGARPKSAAQATTRMSGNNAQPSHCPYTQAALLQQALCPDKMRVAFLLGAGCPVAIRVTDGDGTRPLIPDIDGLTRRVQNALKACADHAPCLEAVLKRLADENKAGSNIEDILSHVRALHEVVGTGAVDGMNKQALAALDAEICKVITGAVDVGLPTIHTPYHQLAMWVGGTHRAHPIEIFTPNYDLLLESALEQRHVPYFDGFVGSHRTFFDVASMENGDLPSRWARLWKVHGSVNWWRTPAGDVERRSGSSGNDRQMIYPSHLKYDQSRRMPYLAMIDRGSQRPVPHQR